MMIPPTTPTTFRKSLEELLLCQPDRRSIRLVQCANGEGGARTLLHDISTGVTWGLLGAAYVIMAVGQTPEPLAESEPSTDSSARDLPYCPKQPENFRQWCRVWRIIEPRLKGKTVEKSGRISKGALRNFSEILKNKHADRRSVVRKIKVLVLLDAHDYQRLAERARADEREPYQQATFIVRQALAPGSPSALREENLRLVTENAQLRDAWSVTLGSSPHVWIRKTNGEGR